jgi:hypothetical protein
MPWLRIGGASRFIVRPIKVFDITRETLGLGPILVRHNGLGVKGVAEGHLIHRDRRLVELDQVPSIQKLLADQFCLHIATMFPIRCAAGLRCWLCQHRFVIHEVGCLMRAKSFL